MEKIYIEEKETNYDIKSYLKPEYIYIPIKNNCKLCVKENDYVYKGNMIAAYDNIKISSTISGIVRGITYKYLYNGKKERCLIIENDFKEKVERKSIILNNNGLLIDKDTKYIIINCIDNEPYIFVKRSIINNYADKLLKFLDNCITNTKVYICISNNDINSYNILNKYLGTYINMEIVRIDNYVMSSNENFLIKEVFGYDNKKVKVLDINYLYKNFNVSDCIITVGNINAKVKEYTLLSEIINYFNFDKKQFIFINGVLGGLSFNFDDVVITNDIISVYFIDKRKNYELECTNCGKCTKVCPADLVPVFIINNINKIENLSKLNIEKCLGCGLCSYVCPSNINLKEYIRKAKENIYE